MAALDMNNEISAAPDPAQLELVRIATLDAKKGTKEPETFLVIFNEPHDAENPLDWHTGRKWMVTDVLSATGFNRIMVSTIMAPALSTIANELNMNSTEAAMSLSVYLLATAIGPLFIGPLSEIYGRQVILHASNVWFLIWNIICGFATTKGTLIASRFLAGFGASAIYVLAGGVLGDVWKPEQRGRSLGIYLLIPLLGSAVGPIIGGFMAARTTWRWMFWATSIFQAVMIFVSFFSFDESYGPLILRRRAHRLRQETGNTQYHTEAERRDGDRGAGAIIKRNLSRPLRLLISHPIIQVSATLSGFSYGLLYITLSTFSELWVAQYHQSVEISGLHYIACSIGNIVASQVGGLIMDYAYKRKPNTSATPESRLLLMFPSMIIAWSGLLFYGWTAEYRLPWPVVDAGVFVMMFGMQLEGLPTTAYIIDTYGDHTSSAMAAQRFVTSLTAFLFPLFAPRMYQSLGYGWTNTILAFAGLGLGIPLTLYLWKSGAKLRAKAISTY